MGKDKKAPGSKKSVSKAPGSKKSGSLRRASSRQGVSLGGTASTRGGVPRGASTRAARTAGKGSASSVDAIIAEARKAAFTDEAPERAFAHFRAEAEALPADDYPIFTGQALLMRSNIREALSLLEPHLPAVVSQLREPALREVFELPSLTMALDFATGRVPLAKLSSGELEKMLAEGAPWRELMLTYLEVASHPYLNLVPRERVAAIRAGSGRLDKAQDFVALAGLFAEFALPLAGKHPFPEFYVDRLATLGGTLVQQLRPGNAIAPTAKRTPEALLRDRLAALVADRYDRLQVMASVALGKRKADDLLPALRSAAAPERAADRETNGKGAEPAAPV